MVRIMCETMNDSSIGGPSLTVIFKSGICTVYVCCKLCYIHEVSVLVSYIAASVDILTLEGEITVLSRNARHQIPSNVKSHTRRMGTSATPLPEPKN
jgi:hypothetical protein